MHQPSIFKQKRVALRQVMHWWKRRRERKVMQCRMFMLHSQSVPLCVDVRELILLYGTNSKTLGLIK